MRTVVAILLLFVGAVVNAQKKPISLESLDEWEWFSERRISNSGEWISFATSPSSGESLLRIKNMRNAKLFQFPGAGFCRFTADSRKAIFLKKGREGNDTTVVMDLLTEEQWRLTNIRSFLVADSNSAVYGFLQGVSDTATLYIKSTGDALSFSAAGVSRFWFMPNGEAIFYTIQSAHGMALIQRNLLTAQIDTIATALMQFGALTFDQQYSKIAFSSDQGTGMNVRLYDLTTRQTRNLSWNPVDSNYQLNNRSSLRFIDNGRKLIIAASYRYPFRQEANKTGIKLELWSYTDDRLYPQQKKELNRDLNLPYYFLYSVENDKCFQLTDTAVDQMVLPAAENFDHVLVFTGKPYRFMTQWDPVVRRDAYVTDIATGHRVLIARAIAGDLTISPNGKFVLWFDRNRQQYCSYAVKQGRTKVISRGITDPLTAPPTMPEPPEALGTAGWMKNDSAVIFNTTFDVWSADPTGLKAPVNLSKGYGRKHRIRLQFYAQRKEGIAFAKTDTLLLYGTDLNTKDAGFFALQPGVVREPRRLLWGPLAFAFPGMALASGSNDLLLSFGKNDQYGLFYSNDLLHFDTVYQLNPQRERYNWYKTELVRWTTSAGRPTEGVVYKPENFDPHKKYPVIVWLYENDQAKNINSYILPKWSGSIIDFAFYASNGYVVFVPDIPYQMGQPGKSAEDAVLSGLQQLNKQGWVDMKRLGIQGHSWGGYQIAYIVTKTHLFKAAAAGAAVSDMVSAYGGIRSNLGESRQWIYEKNQSRIGRSLWEEPQLYIENSPLFGADRIQTPLLLMHNEKDGGVPFAQSVELFAALKRLGKKAWLLNYPEENHVLGNNANKRDFTIRMYQFFEHFLRDRPAPNWLLQGIPAVQEGYEKGY